jgi:hypothetical protein
MALGANIAFIAGGALTAVGGVLAFIGLTGGDA